MDDDMANLIVAQLLYLDSADKKRDITMYVNSPGGSVTAGKHSSPLHFYSFPLQVFHRELDAVKSFVELYMSLPLPWKGSNTMAASLPDASTMSVNCPRYITKR